MKTFMTVDDLADYLRLAHGTIYNKVHRREIPFLKIGRSIRFDLEEINKWATRKKFAPHSN